MASDRVALVTGASRGIGRGIAVALAGHGWNVVVNYRGNAEAAEATRQAVEAAGAACLLVQADVGDAGDRGRLLAETLAHFGRVDLLVNNAGMGPRQRVDLLDVTEASYDEVMAVNLKGPFFLAQAVARQMIAQVQAGSSTRPRIVNLGSISAYTASTNRAEYCVSKAGVAMVTALFADRLAGHGIGVYEIRPGIIETDMTGPAKAKYDRLIAEGLTPIRRWGAAEDVAAAVVAIAEGYLDFSTGEVINVDGGFHLRRL
jgi:3-oxoacyl-[acyl-carrier protein] reductase